MEHEFWHEKWDKNEIGFHLDGPHPWFIRAIDDVAISKNQTVFVPLCGKTHDIDLLLQQGCNVVANELSELAIDALFSRLQLTPQISRWQGVEPSYQGKLYKSGQLTVLVGDYFQLTPSLLSSVYGGHMDWVYDRAALVALPLPMRKQYSQALMQLCPQAKQILMTLDYDQNQMSGPPFSVTPEEIQQHYGTFYKVTPMQEQNIIEKEPKFQQRGLTAFYQRLFMLEVK